MLSSIFVNFHLPVLRIICSSLIFFILLQTSLNLVSQHLCVKHNADVAVAVVCDHRAVTTDYSLSKSPLLLITFNLVIVVCIVIGVSITEESTTGE